MDYASCDLDELLGRLVAFDVETHEFTATNLTPPLVCSGIARLADDSDLLEGRLLDKQETLDIFEAFLRDPDLIIVGANIAYDIAVCINERPALLDLAIEALQNDRFFDVQLAQGLDAIARGHLGKNPDGSNFPYEPGKEFYEDGPKKGKKRPVPNRYSLWQCVRLTLGRTDAKNNNAYKRAYQELEKLPMDAWPEEARQYPVDDAKNTLEVAIEQLSRGRGGRPIPARTADGAIVPGQYVPEPPDEDLQFKNLIDVSNQCRAGSALHWASTVGWNVDNDNIAKLRALVDERERVGMEKFGPDGAGIFRKDGSQNEKLTKQLLLRAHGAQPCPDGDKTPPPPPPEPPTPLEPPRAVMDAKEQKARARLEAAQEKLVAKHERDLLRHARQVEKQNEARHKECANCRGFGWTIPGSVTTTPTGDVSIGREALQMSGDPLLEDLAEWLEDEKVATTYLPWLETANPTLHPRPNVLLVTRRTSYDGPAQLLPANREYNSAMMKLCRPCIRAAPGYELISIDYSQLELLTFSQTCLWVLGESSMAEAINQGLDLHTSFAAAMLERPYEELLALINSGKKAVKEGRALTKAEIEADTYRQVAKSVNFGLPGGMGAVRFVLSLRAKKTYVCRAFGFEVCSMMALEKGGLICSNCLSIAQELRRKWLARWTEAQPYLDWAADIADNVGIVPQFVPKGMGLPFNERCDILGLRGGVGYADAGNSNFQGLGAIGAKDAFWHCTKACYEMKDERLHGTVPIHFQHDENIYKSLLGRSREAGPVLAKIQVDRMRLWVPDVAAGVKANETYMTNWSK